MGFSGTKQICSHGNKAGSGSCVLCVAQIVFKSMLMFFFFILKVNDSNAVNQAMNHIFALLDTNDKLRQIYGERVLDVFIYDSVPKQRKTLRKICTFLEIYCDDSFSSGIETLFGDDITSRPRDQVEWREEDKDLIENYMKKFDFLQPFSFDSSY